jgi:cytochrome c peroxidase
MLTIQYERTDGSYGPVLLRLAWHCSGTYDKETGSGGSNGATMRFAPESDHGANAGLHHAREKLEPVKKQFPEITYSDLWVSFGPVPLCGLFCIARFSHVFDFDLFFFLPWQTLAGVVAVQEMGGPKVAWRPGRQDGLAENCTPDGRLPGERPSHFACTHRVS